MADWLRPVFGRRTQGSSISERPGSFSVDESVGSEDGNAPTPTPRLRPTSRVSSYIGIRPATPPIPQTSDTFFSFRVPESVYHEPSKDQMAEMLKTVMMTQSSTTPVPVEYNSCILHVLEAYHDMRVELRRTEETIEELKHTHTKDIKDFETLATQWEMKEQNYKSEMKKLEVLLSKTDGGLEKVSLARSKSTVHGAQRVGESIKRDIGTIKARHAARSSRERSGISGDTPIDASTSHRYRADRFFKTRIKTNPQDSSSVVNNERLETPSRILQTQSSTGTLAMYASPAQMEEPTAHNETAKVDLAALTKAQLKALARQRAHEEFGVEFDSSESESESSTNSHHEAFSPVTIPKGLGIEYKKLDTSKRTVLKKPSTLSMNESYTSQYDTLSKDSPQQMGFSFRPGDDADTLAQRLRTGQTTQRPMSQCDRPGSSAEIDEQSEDATLIRLRKLELSPYTMTDSKVGVRRPPMTSSRTSSRPRNLQDSEGLKRDDSSGSFVTALRDNSGRSSANGSQNNSQTRRKLDRSTGSSEAVTAAARAFGSAPGAKRSSAQRKSGSGSVEGGSQGGSNARTK
ncbi:hypothetical protein BKA65DRAFT_190762 [Rhexocercosporidium sp. MPI-PUGE-AT-0058]|nr:hypothetical protein BKA65DRAFT_190762 [Rhexocercosporidium sp. MPI-PUGE-AT-0058]